MACRKLWRSRFGGGKMDWKSRAFFVEIWRVVVGHMSLKIKVKDTEMQMWESVVCGSEALISLVFPEHLTAPSPPAPLPASAIATALLPFLTFLLKSSFQKGLTMLYKNLWTWYSITLSSGAISNTVHPAGSLGQPIHLTSTPPLKWEWR